MLEQHQMGYFGLFWNDHLSASATMRDWRLLLSSCKDKRLSLESLIPEVLSDIARRSAPNIYEFVLYEIVQEGHLPSLKPQAFLSGLWEDWQVYLPLPSQSSSFLNVCRLVDFRFGLQQKSFVMMKSQSFLSIFHFEGTEGLCGVVERDLLCANGFDIYVLLQW